MTPPSAPAATVLIVDDTPANLGVLFDLLSTAGFEVLVATDGPSAVQRAVFVKPGLILLSNCKFDLQWVDGCQTTLTRLRWFSPEN